MAAIMYADCKRHKIDRVIWCCPVSLKINTRNEILKHTDCTPGDICVFDSKINDKNFPLCSWYIVGLESIGSSDRVVMAFNAMVDKRTLLIVDESSYIKGHRAKRTNRLLLIGRNASYRMVLNGTPITQGIEDLYTQITFLSQKILGYYSWYTFAKKHLEYDDLYRGLIRKRKAQDWLMAKIEPYVYQVTKEECLDLPEKTFSSRTVPLTYEQKRLYEECKSRLISRIEEWDYDGTYGTDYDRLLSISVFVTFSELQSIVNGLIPRSMKNGGQSIETNKNSELISVLQGISPDKPVIIWCRYLKSVEVVQYLLSINFDVNISVYHGQLSEKKRDEELRRWRKNGGYFIATSGCGGFGLTLTEAAYAIFYTSGFKYGERLQSEDRIHRIGQCRNVHYIDLWTKSGIEMRIRHAIEYKGDALADFKRQLNMLKKQGKNAIKNYLKEI